MLVRLINHRHAVINWRDRIGRLRGRRLAAVNILLIAGVGGREGGREGGSGLIEAAEVG